MSESRYRALFPRAMESPYLDTAAEGLPVPGVEDAFTEYLAEKGRGTPGRVKHFAKEQEARTLAADLLGTSKEHVAFASSASDALNLLAASLPLSAGDEVVITDLEFPSNVLPWLALARRGVRTIVVPSVDGAVRLADLRHAMTEKTRAVSLSLVSYKSGAYFPYISGLAELVHSIGAMLCVDATQALGRCPIPLSGVDYLMASSFKWLLGPHGLAIVYLSPQFRAKFDPLGVGWYSVDPLFTRDRFEHYTLKQDAGCVTAGMPNFPSLYAMCEALRFHVSLDQPAEQARANDLCRYLRDELEAQGFDLLTPRDPALTSGIVSFEHPRAEEIGNLLHREGIVVWAGDGRVRASVHYYNNSSDIEAYAAALKQVVNQGVYAG